MGVNVRPERCMRTPYKTLEALGMFVGSKGVPYSGGARGPPTDPPTWGSLLVAFQDAVAVPIQVCKALVRIWPVRVVAFLKLNASPKR